MFALKSTDLSCCLTASLALYATGLTASLKNACRQYGLTEEQVRQANLPCQYRSFRGNSYIVVKLSDMANLKATLQKQAMEAAKQKLIDELGEDGYAKRMAELKAAKMKEKADLKAAKVKKEKVDKLSSLLFDALAASEGGISPTLAGTTISMTAAEKEWRVKSHEIVGHLKPVDPTKTRLKYYLSDVIGVAHNKGASSFSAKLESSPDRRKLYARYLVDTFLAQCKAYNEVGDSDIVQEVRRAASGSIEKALGEYEQLINRYRNLAVKEKERLNTLDSLMAELFEE